MSCTTDNTPSVRGERERNRNAPHHIARPTWTPGNLAETNAARCCKTQRFRAAQARQTTRLPSFPHDLTRVTTSRISHPPSYGGKRSHPHRPTETATNKIAVRWHVTAFRCPQEKGRKYPRLPLLARVTSKTAGDASLSRKRSREQCVRYQSKSNSSREEESREGSMPSELLWASNRA